LGDGALESQNELLDDLLSVCALHVPTVVVDGTRNALEPGSDTDDAVIKRSHCTHDNRQRYTPSVIDDTQICFQTRNHTIVFDRCYLF